nr:methyltransferase domain-containing protein [Victivallis sp. Marseille-Q1083]
MGCGPGNSTKVLRDIFSDANILGIDNSPNMIEKAKAEQPDINFRLCDAMSLDGKYDLLFSNACLQWIPDHATLIPAFMDRLNDGGMLAVQVPMNGDEPLFRLIREVADEPKWGLAGVPLQPNEVLMPAEYYNILSRCSSAFEGGIFPTSQNAEPYRPAAGLRRASAADGRRNSAAPAASFLKIVSSGRAGNDQTVLRATMRKRCSVLSR